MKRQAGFVWGLVVVFVLLFTGGCGDGIGYNTKLKIKSNELHSGMSFQEVTNLLSEFEVLSSTNYPTPVRMIWNPTEQRDRVVKVYSTNLTSAYILILGPQRGWMWRDDCAIDFDARGMIVGYCWEQIH
jgi:hypothetical protein